MRERLFEKMRCDLCVMAEWGDDEVALREEVMSCDQETFKTYCEIWEIEH